MTLKDRIAYARSVIALAESNVELARRKCSAFLPIVEKDLEDAKVRLGILLAEAECKNYVGARLTHKQLGLQKVAMSIFGDGLRSK